MAGSGKIYKLAEIEITYNPAVKPSEMVKICCSSEAEKVFRNIWKQSIELRESFFAIYLNKGHKVLGYMMVSLGGISGTVVDPKVIFQAALKANASAVILAHNHPSGNREPSDADIAVTRKLKEAGVFLGIAVLDHKILLPDGYSSLADEGLM